MKTIIIILGIASACCFGFTEEEHTVSGVNDSCIYLITLQWHDNGIYEARQCLTAFELLDSFYTFYLYGGASFKIHKDSLDRLQMIY